MFRNPDHVRGVKPLTNKHDTSMIQTMVQVHSFGVFNANIQVVSLYYVSFHAEIAPSLRHALITLCSVVWTLVRILPQ